MSQKVLIVEDEPSISILLEYHIKLAGYQTACVADGESALESVRTFRPDLIVLDLMLPKMNGIQVCRMLRSHNNPVAILMLTALQDLSDIVAGLDHGADDYMTKPFSPQELISRIKAILRRSAVSDKIVPEETLTVGNLQVRPSLREALINGRIMELTPKEFDLLLFMMIHQGKVLSRQQLLNEVWNYHFVGDTRIVDVHISHLRDKIEDNSRSPEYILTVRNVGYKLTHPNSNTQHKAL